MIRAIYEDGVFRPRGPVKLPEGCEVEFEPRVTNTSPAVEAQAREGVYEALRGRHASGESDVSERHNEHQP